MDELRSAWAWDELSPADRLWATAAGLGLQATSAKSRFLYRTELPGANLICCRLSQLDLSLSCFSGAHLEHADLRKVNFEETRLDGASLYHANLSWVEARGCSTRCSRAWSCRAAGCAART